MVNHQNRPHGPYLFFVNCNAVLISLKELDLPYISTPPLYTRAPKMAKMTMVTNRMTIPKIASHVGISNIPTRKNIIIGVKKGIYEVIVMKEESGFPRPNMEIMNPATTKSVIGVIICWTSSILLTSDPKKAARVANRKYPRRQKITA